MKKIFVIALMFLSLSTFAQTKVGTLKIFSELQGISVYIDEVKETGNTAAIVAPVGSHYLKVIYQNTSVFGEIIEIKENAITTVLIKNTGQVQEKVMETKTPEREEYNNSKVEILFTTNAVSQTTGKSSYYPGFYGYYGYNKSNTVTTQVSDFKIVQGGVAEISEMSLATLAGNNAILQQNARDNARQAKVSSTGAFIFLGSLAVGVPLLVDMLHKPTPTKPGGFLHPKTAKHPNWEAGALATCIVTGTISYCIVMGSDKHKPAHYYSPDVANRDAQSYNKALKSKLGLPESYDTK